MFEPWTTVSTYNLIRYSCVRFPRIFNEIVYFRGHVVLVITVRARKKKYYYYNRTLLPHGDFSSPTRSVYVQILYFIYEKNNHHRIVQYVASRRAIRRVGTTRDLPGGGFMAKSCSSTLFPFALSSTTTETNNNNNNFRRNFPPLRAIHIYNIIQHATTLR